MIRPAAYEGSEPYIFVSYAHKNSDQVLPVISTLQEQGFRVWYDAGIEVGSEWPEYIAEHLERCNVFLAFLSQAALDSVNCRQEINFAIEERKEMLVVYLEDIRLTAGMRMRLGVLQAMYRNHYSNQESFLDELCRSRVISICNAATAIKEPMSKEPTLPFRKPDLQAISALFEFRQSDDGSIGITKLKDQSRTTVEIPWGVTWIYMDAFRDCSSLTTITIPESVKSIGQAAFMGCSSLVNINIPNSVTRIGPFAFACCGNLTSITIPSNVTSIAIMALHACDKLNIHGQRGSEAERYANQNSIPFIAI